MVLDSPEKGARALTTLYSNLYNGWQNQTLPDPRIPGILPFLKSKDLGVLEVVYNIIDQNRPGLEAHVLQRGGQTYNAYHILANATKLLMDWRDDNGGAQQAQMLLAPFDIDTLPSAGSAQSSPSPSQQATVAQPLPDPSVQMAAAAANQAAAAANQAAATATQVAATTLQPDPNQTAQATPQPVATPPPAAAPTPAPPQSQTAASGSGFGIPVPAILQSTPTWLRLVVVGAVLAIIAYIIFSFLFSGDGSVDGASADLAGLVGTPTVDPFAVQVPLVPTLPPTVDPAFGGVSTATQETATGVAGIAGTTSCPVVPIRNEDWKYSEKRWSEFTDLNPAIAARPLWPQVGVVETANGTYNMQPVTSAATVYPSTTNSQNDLSWINASWDTDLDGFANFDPNKLFINTWLYPLGTTGQLCAGAGQCLDGIDVVVADRGFDSIASNIWLVLSPAVAQQIGWQAGIQYTFRPDCAQ